MKKTIMFIALMGFFTLSFSQGDTIAPITENQEVLIKDVPLSEFTLYADSLQKVLDRINSLSDVPGSAGEIIAFYPKIKDGTVTFIKQVRKPDSSENVSYLIGLIADYAGVIWPLLLSLITFFFRMIRKSPDAALTALGKVTQFIRTRWFVVGLGVVLTTVWGLFFREGDFSVVSFVLFFTGTILKGVGIAEVARWIGGLFKKEVTDVKA